MTGIALTGVIWSSVCWGDYDNDGDLDILITGISYQGDVSKIYRNDAGSFVDMSGTYALTGVDASSSAWGDYDNDGDIDILITGWGPGRTAKIYRNDVVSPSVGTFIDMSGSFSLAGVQWSSVAWGDYDNDGDLDILLTGDASSGRISKIYRNDVNNAAGIFTDMSTVYSLTGVDYSSVSWIDYDNDSDLDILLSGSSNSGYLSKIYRNDVNTSNTFTDMSGVFSFTGVEWCSSAWGDYDNDSDPDLLLTGWGGASGRVSKIYRNDVNTTSTFTDMSYSLDGVDASSVGWGDYDNDGDLDILLTGLTGGAYVTKIYRNDAAIPSAGKFIDMSSTISMTGIQWGSAAWADYDNDGDLDILTTGDSYSGWISKIYRNETSISNTVPFSPTGLTSSF